MMEELFKQLLINIGEDVNREGLLKTPQRAAKAYEFLTKGYREDIDKIINNAIFESDTSEMVVVKNI